MSVRHIFHMLTHPSNSSASHVDCGKRHTFTGPVRLKARSFKEEEEVAITATTTIIPKAAAAAAVEAAATATATRESQNRKKLNTHRWDSVIETHRQTSYERHGTHTSVRM